MKSIVIAGAAGRAGAACANAFVADGWNVKGLVRPGKARASAESLQTVACDATDADALIDACEGADVILHALNPAYDKWEEFALLFGRNILKAAGATGATVMIPGNVYNFGDALGRGMDEATPFRPREKKGRIRVELEDMFRQAAEDGDVRSIVIRAGDFFGGSMPGTWLDLVILKELRKHKVTWPGPRHVAHAFAYLPDLAETFVRVANRRAALGPHAVLHLAGYTLTGEEFHRAMEVVMGRDLKAAAVPWPLLRLGGLVNPLLREVVTMKYLWDEPHSLDDKKLVALIDEVPHTPLETALRQAVIDLCLAPDETSSG